MARRQSRSGGKAHCRFIDIISSISIICFRPVSSINKESTTPAPSNSLTQLRYQVWNSKWNWSPEGIFQVGFLAPSNLKYVILHSHSRLSHPMNSGGAHRRGVPSFILGGQRNSSPWHTTEMFERNEQVPEPSGSIVGTSPKSISSISKLDPLVSRPFLWNTIGFFPMQAYPDPKLAFRILLHMTDEKCRIPFTCVWQIQSSRIAALIWPSCLPSAKI